MSSYLDNEISGLKEDIQASQERVKSRQNILAEEFKSGLGKEMKKQVKPGNKFVKFLKKIFAIYG